MYGRGPLGARRSVQSAISYENVLLSFGSSINLTSIEKSVGALGELRTKSFTKSFGGKLKRLRGEAPPPPTHTHWIEPWCYSRVLRRFTQWYSPCSLWTIVCQTKIKIAIYAAVYAASSVSGGNQSSSQAHSLVIACMQHFPLVHNYSQLGSEQLMMCD